MVGVTPGHHHAMVHESRIARPTLSAPHAYLFEVVVVENDICIEFSAFTWVQNPVAVRYLHRCSVACRAAVYMPDLGLQLNTTLFRLLDSAGSYVIILHDHWPYCKWIIPSCSTWQYLQLKAIFWPSNPDLLFPIFVYRSHLIWKNTTHDVNGCGRWPLGQKLGIKKTGSLRLVDLGFNSFHSQEITTVYPWDKESIY